MSVDNPVVVGIDPGSLVAGYAFLQATCAHPVVPADFRVLDAGILRVDAKLSHQERIALLHVAVYDLAASHQPDVFVLERAFADKNIASALRLGEVRGAFMAVAGRVSAPVKELSPTQIKKSVTGSGKAAKEDVSRAIQSLLGYDRGTLPYDVTDALAIALSYGLCMVGERLIEGATR